MALGKRLAPWEMIARAQRPRTGKPAGPSYTLAKRMITEITDDALSRLHQARQAARKAKT